MTFFIYKIINLVNGKIYVGKTNDIAKRWQTHKLIAMGGPEKYSQHFYLIHSAIAKYGENNFIFEILETSEYEDISYDLENKWIKFFHSDDSSFGYNLTKGGKGIITDKPVSLETRKKISMAQKGIKRRLKYEVTQDTKDKLSKVVKNRGKISEDIKKEVLLLFNNGNYTKKQLSVKFNIRIEAVRHIISYYGKNGFKTDEEKSKNKSLAKKGKSLSEEHKMNVSKSLKGIVFSEERKKNISNSLQGRTIPQDVRDKIAITLSGREDYLEIKKEIIKLFETGKFNKIELSKMFNMKYSSIKKIIKQYKEQKNV